MTGDEARPVPRPGKFRPQIVPRPEPAGDVPAWVTLGASAISVAGSSQAREQARWVVIAWFDERYVYTEDGDRYALPDLVRRTSSSSGRSGKARHRFLREPGDPAATALLIGAQASGGTAPRRRCGKVRYPDEITAKIALANIRGKDSSHRPKLECRVYDCPTCHGFHLTSMDRSSPRRRAS